VLLLNSSLTVNEGLPASHKGYGWEIFTSQVVDLINSKLSGIIFLLWGRHAQEYEKCIDKSKHFIFKTTHPSPLSVRYGFEGCGHFKMANDILRQLGKSEIDWQN
jgi:uracil-DNA glycosylase